MTTIGLTVSGSPCLLLITICASWAIAGLDRPVDDAHCKAAANSVPLGGIGVVTHRERTLQSGNEKGLASEADRAVSRTACLPRPAWPLAQRGAAGHRPWVCEQDVAGWPGQLLLSLTLFS